MIYRMILKKIEQHMFQKKAVIIFGPRQSGKTTLVNMLLQNTSKKIVRFNGDEADIREILSNTTSTRLKSLIGDGEIVFIDEAQRISDIGLTIKLLVDNYPDIQVIATGSSSFELTGKIKEPLTGRKFEFILYPLAYGEMVKFKGLLEEQRLLEHRLVFGYYPEVVTTSGNEMEILKLLADSYLYKDLFVLGQIKKPELLEKIVKALAYQIGSEVSFTEIGNLVGADNQTVQKYISLLERAFIVFRLPALSRNLRNEIRRGVKFFFYDNGVRNAVISNFNHVGSRSDIGALWENFVISERRKVIEYKKLYQSAYFWRTTQQQEIDYIEEINGNFNAYEIKWNPKVRYSFSRTFLENYPIINSKVINRDSYHEFLSLEE